MKISPGEHVSTYFRTFLDQKIKIDFYEILAIFGELLFLGAIFRPEGVKLTTSRVNIAER